MNAVWLAVQSLGFPQWPRLVESVGLMELTSPLGPSILPLTLSQDSSNIDRWLLVPSSIYLTSCWVKLLRGQSMLDSYLSGIGVYPWNGTLVGPGIVWPFPQSLLHRLYLHFL